MKRNSRLFLAVILITFLGTTLGFLWLFVPHDIVNGGSVIFTLAFLAAVAAVWFFVRSNASNIEAIAQKGDLGAIKKMLIGKRTSNLHKHR